MPCGLPKESAAWTVVPVVALPTNDTFIAVDQLEVAPKSPLPRKMLLISPAMFGCASPPLPT